MIPSEHRNAACYFWTAILVLASCVGGCNDKKTALKQNIAKELSDLEHSGSASRGTEVRRQIAPEKLVATKAEGQPLDFS